MAFGFKSTVAPVRISLLGVHVATPDLAHLDPSTRHVPPHPATPWSEAAALTPLANTPQHVQLQPSDTKQACHWRSYLDMQRNSAHTWEWQSLLSFIVHVGMLGWRPQVALSLLRIGLLGGRAITICIVRSTGTGPGRQLWLGRYSSQGCSS
ncbi:hypothetical protein BGX38DRAFT_635421 [Terfezia claveryi]|nr:hypothetical protein BGX38DRAFT_635421 [Terfezia claveryi]